MEKLLDVIDVSRHLNISKRSFEQLLARGEGPRHLLIGRLRRWRSAEIEEWIEQRLHKPAPLEKHPSESPRSDMNR